MWERISGGRERIVVEGERGGGTGGTKVNEKLREDEDQSRNTDSIL
jgi:hypothetical protein